MNHGFVRDVQRALTRLEREEDYSPTDKNKQVHDAIRGDSPGDTL